MSSYDVSTCLWYIYISHSAFFHSYLMANFLLQSPIISECFFMQVLSTRDAVRSKITIHDRIFIVYALERKLLLFSFEIVLRLVNVAKDKFHSTRPSSHMKLNRYAPNNTRISREMRNDNNNTAKTRF